MKRWRPTKGAMAIIRDCAKRVSESKRVSLEIARRQDLKTGEEAMDLNVLGETDLSDHWPIKELAAGKLWGRVTPAPLVEVWVYAWIGFGGDAYTDLQDQLLVQFDEKGEVKTVRTTSRTGALLYKGDK